MNDGHSLPPKLPLPDRHQVAAGVVAVLSVGKLRFRQEFFVGGFGWVTIGIPLP
jgi:hypothetical protein